MELFFISEDTTINNTIDWIRKLAIKGSQHPEIIEIAKECLQSENPLKKLFDIAYCNIVYVPDNLETQTLRTLQNIVTHGKGNCVHYSTFISSVLILLKKEHYFKVVSYDKPNIFEHIYIECDNILLDPVLGQSQNGTDEYCRPLNGKFNQEKKYKYSKLYYMPKLQVLNGTENKINSVTNIPIVGRTQAVRLKKYLSVLGCSNSNKDCGLGCSCKANK